MTAILIASIGSRDVQIDPGLLPEHLRDFRTASERERGIFLHSNYTSFRPHLNLAIIRKCITYILEESGTLERVVLIASDQNDPQYTAKDTIETAKVAKQLIVDGWHIPQENIEVWPLRSSMGETNPADVDAVLRDLDPKLREIDHTQIYDTAYLEVTGGTTAMSEGLLLAGTKVFQQRAIALYISPTSEMPHRLAVGKRLLGGPLLDITKAHLHNFQYAAAMDAFKLYRPIYTDIASDGKADLVEAILRHATHRINLDIPAAQSAIRGADTREGGRYRRHIEPLYNAVHRPERGQLLAEVLYVAQIRMETQAYTDFLTQLVRFVENALRLLCLNRGVQFINFAKHVDDNGSKVDSSWLAQNLFKPVPMGQAGLQQLLEQLAPHDTQVRQLLDGADKLKQLIWLRNESTHSLSGISANDMSTAFGANYQGILPLLETLYEGITGTTLPSNPYHSINAFVIELLNE